MNLKNQNRCELRSHVAGGSTDRARRQAVEACGSEGIKVRAIELLRREVALSICVLSASALMLLHRELQYVGACAQEEVEIPQFREGEAADARELILNGNTLLPSYKQRQSNNEK